MGKKTGKNPTDRGKLGVKRSVLTDGRGMPIGVAVAGANVHDQRLVEATLDSIPVPRPGPAAGASNISVATRATMPTRFVAPPVADATRHTSAPAAKNKHNAAADIAHAAGSSNGSTRG